MSSSHVGTRAAMFLLFLMMQNYHILIKADVTIKGEFVPFLLIFEYSKLFLVELAFL